MLDSVFTYTDADLSLSETDEADLIVRAQAGDEDAKMTLIYAYGPALRAAVRRFGKGTDGENGEIDLGDLQSVALIAFLEAVEAHDAEKSPRLLVKRHLLKRLAEEFGAVAAFTVPARTLSRFYGILKAADGNADEAEALAPEHGMSVEVFRDVLAAVRGTASLDGLVSEEGGPEVEASSVFSASPIVDVEDRILVEVAFRAVDDEEERICRLAYGFTEYEPLSDGEISERMDLFRSTVQRKRGKALGKMRKALGVTLDA